LALKAAIPAPPLTVLAPLADASSGRPSEPRAAAAMATLVPLAEDLMPAPCTGAICVDELIPESNSLEQLLTSMLAFNASRHGQSIHESYSDLLGEMGSELACFSTTSTAVPVPPESSCYRRRDSQRRARGGAVGARPV
jgi:hypothetical protein